MKALPALLREYNMGSDYGRHLQCPAQHLAPEALLP